jgi:hypothetical protein
MLDAALNILGDASREKEGSYIDTICRCPDRRDGCGLAGVGVSEDRVIRGWNGFRFWNVIESLSIETSWMVLLDINKHGNIEMAHK